MATRSWWLALSCCVAGLVEGACNRESRPDAAAVPALSVTTPAAAVAGASAAVAMPSDAAPSAGAPKAEAKPYQVTLAASGDFSVGKQGFAEVTLVALDGYHCNEAYPYKLKLQPSEGLTFPAETVTRDAVTVSAERAVMRVPFTPTSAGSKTLAGRFYFSVCTAEICLTERQDLSLSVVVK